MLLSMHHAAVYRPVIIAFSILIFCSGCIFFSGLGRDRADSRETPQKTLEIFRKALETRDYSTAYHCLSKKTQGRYQYSHFRMMFEYTVFGLLIKNMVVSWGVESVKYSGNRDEATVRLRHQYDRQYKKDFVFVYENKGWRLDFTLARVLGMPQADEDILYPPEPEKEKKEEAPDKKSDVK